MARTNSAILALALLAACHKTNGEEPLANWQNNETRPVPAADRPTSNTAKAQAPASLSTPETLAPAPGTAGGLPDDKTPLSEPRGSIDPKSAEAAGQIVQKFGAFIEEKRFREAEKLWGDSASARRTTKEIQNFSQAHLEVGKPGDMEGAAGSSYITVPVVLYGQPIGKGASHRSGSMVLRRVNDVPGSSEAQRRWHIERIDWNAL